MEVNHTVLLIDADLRRPSIHEHFGYTPEKGLNDYLLSDALIEDILIYPADDVMAFSPHLDSILFVIEDGAVTYEELSRAAELLKDTNLLGTVLKQI